LILSFGRCGDLSRRLGCGLSLSVFACHRRDVPHQSLIKVVLAERFARA
jgi:hypothetical protein